MSSLDIVDFISHIRKPGSAILRHDHFMTKVSSEIDNALNFKGIYFDKLGREKPCYYLDEEASTLMAMSYSKVVRKTIYRAWKEAEKKVASNAVSLPNFDDPVAAAEAWIAERKQANVLKVELITSRHRHYHHPSNGSRCGPRQATDLRCRHRHRTRLHRCRGDDPDRECPETAQLLGGR